ncbi:MAG: hypothetical protein IJ938_01170, partial [Clostridia bacterium]|nr:hypothetical protein [Clostridia bacterium]
MPSKHRVKITVDGKAYWVGGKTEKEARKRAEAKRAKLEDGARTIRKNMLVKDWAEEWVKTY